MKKPDILLFLTLLVVLGATVTEVVSEERQKSTGIASEASIR